MKISVLQHAPSQHLPVRPGDPTPTSRNLDPLLHPFAKARERTRALNAAKMDRIFAKPFVASLEGHVDAVECLARQPGTLSAVASGSWDGGLIVHDISTRERRLHVPQAHKGKVTGVCYAGEGRVLSCGVDKTVKLWDVGHGEERNVFPAKHAFNTIDHHRTDPIFATGSSLVQIWDETKSAPISNLTFPTSTETVTAVRFNLAESSVLASIGSDRTFTLYDIRTGKAERRVVMTMRNNSLAWSPTFPTSVLLASEDHNLYTFDIRHLDTPTQIYKAHVAAVMSCDWAPTGLEFVSGGWDRTVRIWKEGRGHSPEVYHTKRMQRVSSTIFTGDARFVVSGSDDGNVRVWKAKASDKLGIITARERAAMEYRDSLKERWKNDKEVNKVIRWVGPPPPQTRLQGRIPQAHDAGGETRQGGAETEAHTRGGEQAKSREEEGGYPGAIM
ncbi:WD40 repeat-like protein, partial [Schizophyllum commune]